MTHFLYLTIIATILFISYYLYINPLSYRHTITSEKSTEDCFETGGYIIIRPEEDIKCYNAPLKN